VPLGFLCARKASGQWKSTRCWLSSVSRIRSPRRNSQPGARRRHRERARQIEQNIRAPRACTARHCRLYPWPHSSHLDRDLHHSLGLGRQCGTTLTVAFSSPLDVDMFSSTLRTLPGSDRRGSNRRPAGA